MTSRDIDEILRRGASSDVDPALLDRISKSIASSLTPVRPLAPKWVLASGLFLTCAAVACAAGALLGLKGLRVLSATEIACIFPVLGILTSVSAMSSAAAMTPGSAFRVAGAYQPAIGSVALVAVFGTLFHDYRVDRFVPSGLVCLTAGLLIAIPAGIAAVYIVRRGFAVNRRAAGIVTGTLAGLAGVTMLELHCANLQALHVLIWHTAVVPLSGLAGALLGTASWTRRNDK